jgi:hypothetical protein
MHRCYNKKIPFQYAQGVVKMKKILIILGVVVIGIFFFAM